MAFNPFELDRMHRIIGSNGDSLNTTYQDHSIPFHIHQMYKDKTS